MDDGISRLRNYTRIDTLGSGSYGEVSLFECNRVKYAIKRLSLVNTISTMMEISLYNALSHPNILRPLEVISLDKGIENIVMQVGEKPLYRRIDENLRPDEITLIMRQLLTALDYMHSNNIIHRDIKPDNILMNGSFTQLIDFGLATYMFRDKCTYYHVYTRLYRAPEIYNKLPYNTKADIFAMGATLFEMLYKYYMVEVIEILNAEFGYEHVIQAVETARKVVSTDPRINMNLKLLLLSMIDNDPDKRLSAKELLQLPIFDKFTYSDPDIIQWKVIDIDQYPDVERLTSKVLIPEAADYATRLNIAIHESSLVKNSSGEQIKNIELILRYIAYCIYNDAGYSLMYQLVLNKDGTPKYDVLELILNIFKELKYNVIIL